MTIKVGINGFGRIGRCLARIITDERDDLELVKINATGDKHVNTHLLNFDSVHGRWESDIDVEWTHTRDINLLNWEDIDIVLECTGQFRDGSKSSIHIENGAKNVLISSPGINVDRTVVYGVNHRDITKEDSIISSASCTTNCLAPIVKVLNDNFGIIRGSMTTIHSYTGDQATIDRRHDDLYRARAAALSMIPTTTGAAKALKSVLPEMEGKIIGSAIRVPTPNVSCIDLHFYSEADVDVETVNELVKTASENEMKGIIGFETRPLVSMDFNTTNESCIFAADSTLVCGKLVRVLCWYDNEWAFSNRMADTASHIGLINEY